MSTSSKFTIMPTPEKSHIDKKEYRVIKLDNGLTAMLISDLASLREGEEIKSQIEEDNDISESESENENSYDRECSEESSSEEGSCDENDHIEKEEYLPAAAIRIGAGSLEDPKERGGLMHFLEHMVFMGSTKYPKESYFEAFIQRHGGSDNGFTELECTTYYFEVQEEYLKKSLDVFAQFFISPLIKKEAICREKRAVHSEFQLALPNDECRIEHFYGTLANSDHPLSTFMWGNDETLDFNISDEELQTLLFDLWKRYYSSEHMKLVVQARESLDTLQEWVIEIFSKVPNNNLHRPTYDHLPFPWEMEQWNKFYGIVPVTEITTVHIAWALPSLRSKYKSKPLDYISNLIADEGLGSILSFLKKKMFALELIAGSEDDEVDHNSIYCLFTVTIKLTEEGFKNLDTVLLTVFQYFNLMRSLPLDSRFFEEHRKIDDMAFNYESEDSAIRNVEELATNMTLFPPKHYINGSELVFDYEPQEIEKILQLLTPDKCNIIVQSKNYSKNGLTQQSEKWFGIKYFSKDIPNDWKEMWDKFPTNSELHFPPPNPYVTSDFSLSLHNDNATEYPVKIINDTVGELWYKQDNKFNLPKGACFIYWINKDWCKSAKTAAAINLYIKLFYHIYSESLYPINEALFEHIISEDNMGVYIKLTGFNEHLVKCLKLFKTKMSELVNIVDDNTFIHIKKELLKCYHNGLISPDKMKTDVRLSILLDTHWQMAERFLALDSLNINSFRDELEDSFGTYYTKVLVQGNFTAAQAEEMYDVMVSKDPSSKNKLFEVTTKKIKVGSWSARVASLNQADPNSAVINYYQDGPGNMWKEVLNQFLLYLMSEPAYDFLRTKETLGYSVSCSNRNTHGILGFTVTVNYQANKHNVVLVDSKIEEFLRHFKSYLTKMPTFEYNEFLNSFRKDKLTIDLALSDEMERNWQEVISGEYVFNRCQRHYELIPKITRDNVLSRLSQLTVPKNESYRKLSIQVEGSEMPEWNHCPEYEDSLKLSYEDIVRCITPDEGDEGSTNFIKDLQNFKRSLDYHPATKIL